MHSLIKNIRHPRTQSFPLLATIHIHEIGNKMTKNIAGKVPRLKMLTSFDAFNFSLHFAIQTAGAWTITDVLHGIISQSRNAGVRHILSSFFFFLLATVFSQMSCKNSLRKRLFLRATMARILCKTKSLLDETFQLVPRSL